MKSTREKILQTLLRRPRSTISELAEAVGINPISVRHHLTNLQAEGLVGAEEERHGVGRPRLVYSLTEEGVEHFPSRYLRLTSRLLDQLKTTMPEPMIRTLFQQMASAIAEAHAEQMRGKSSMEERLTFAKALLADEGFTIEWEKLGDEYHIHEVACPYLQVGQNHPEICVVDQALISKMLAVPVEKIHCVLSGDTQCTYVIRAEERKK